MFLQAVCFIESHTSPSHAHIAEANMSPLPPPPTEPPVFKDSQGNVIQPYQVRNSNNHVPRPPTMTSVHIVEEYSSQVITT